MSPYSKVHANPNGPGDARQTAMEIIRDEGMIDGLKGQAIVITGISSGIGVETARALAATGADLFLTARNVGKARSALADFYDPQRMDIVEMDQANFTSVRQAASAILAKTRKVHLLVNNAGIMAIPDLRFTSDGHELQFGTNHLAHFLLFKLLQPALLAAASEVPPSRVVVLSSSGHNIHGLNGGGHYNFQQNDYDPFSAYGQSKTANIYISNVIERRFGSRHLHSTSIHPGIIATGLAQHMPPDAFKGMEHLYPVMKSVEQGAAISVLAAVGRRWKHQGGKYLVDCDIAPPHTDQDDAFTSGGYAQDAYDEEKAIRLWNDSLALVGLPGKE
ncbi:hypothetical protein MBLNU13_g06412t1 [Cladosporium sp. NU13]